MTTTGSENVPRNFREVALIMTALREDVAELRVALGQLYNMVVGSIVAMVVACSGAILTLMLR